MSECFDWKKNKKTKMKNNKLSKKEPCQLLIIIQKQKLLWPGSPKLHPALWPTVDVNQASLSNSLVIALQQNNQIIL